MNGKLISGAINKLTSFALILCLFLSAFSIVAHAESKTPTLHNGITLEVLNEQYTQLTLDLARAEKDAQRTLAKLMVTGERLAEHYQKQLERYAASAKEDWRRAEYQRMAKQLDAEWRTFLLQGPDHVMMAANEPGAPILSHHMALGGFIPPHNGQDGQYFAFITNPAQREARDMQELFAKAVQARRNAISLAHRLAEVEQLLRSVR